jgi:hypothetical protein
MRIFSTRENRGSVEGKTGNLAVDHISGIRCELVSRLIPSHHQNFCTKISAFRELMANVAKTVNEFMADNTTDNQARVQLAGTYFQVNIVDTSSKLPILVAAEFAVAVTPSNIKKQSCLNVTLGEVIDGDLIKTILVPASAAKSC